MSVYLSRLSGKRTAFTLADVFHPVGKSHKFAFTLAEVFSPHPTSQRRTAFTLAEVLITLGIIGVVAAMTMPTLMAQHRKQVVETRLAKFYSTMNQAIKMAEAEYGDITTWEQFNKMEQTEDGGTKRVINREYFDKYIGAYINPLKIEELDNYQGGGVIKVDFPDGSTATFSSLSIAFYPNIKDFILNENENGLMIRDSENSGKKWFTFYLNPIDNTTANKYHYGKGIEPYKHNWDGEESSLRNSSNVGCRETVSNERAYCTALIQLNGWKIPKDYPLKF